MIMRLIKKMGGGRRRTVAKQKGGQFRSKINNCTNIIVKEKRTYGYELRVTLHHCNMILYTVRKCNN